MSFGINWLISIILLKIQLVIYRVERILLDFHPKFDGAQPHDGDMNRGTYLHLEIVKGTHYRRVEFRKPVTDQVNTYFITESHRNVVQEMTEKILDQAQSVLNEFQDDKNDYNPTFTRKILVKMEELIKSFSEEHKNDFTLTQEYRSDIYLTVCSYAIPVFEEIATSFQRENDPRVYLDLEVKKPMFTKFKDHYYQTRGEEAIANNICAHLERPIKSQIVKTLGSKIVKQMKRSEHYFNSKMALKVKILTDLYKKNDFELYMFYISDVRKSIEDWLRQYTIEYCDKEVNGRLLKRK